MTKLQTHLCATCEDKGCQPRMPIPLLRPPSMQGVPSIAALEGFCSTVQMLALSASAAAAAGESKQQRFPPAPVQPPYQCANPPHGCSASDYKAVLADVSGLSSAEVACTELYSCARHSKVDACQAILDIWSQAPSHHGSSKQAKGTVSCPSPLPLPSPLPSPSLLPLLVPSPLLLLSL